MQFDELGLRAELMGAVRSEGYSVPTPIQAKAIPVVLDGRDVLAGAQTGTGKTAAFTLPMLQLLSYSEEHPKKGRRPRALVVTPTRELAAQVAESVDTYGANLRLRSAVIYGGVGIHPQIDAIRRGVDILIATPGRLLDHAGRPTVDLSRIEILVLDEADRMLDMGFLPDIKRVMKLLPSKRQNLLFSATYTDDVKRFADGLLHNPEVIEVARRNTAAETVAQVVHPVGRTRKRALLTHLIKEGDWNRVLVFTRTKHGANRLTKQLATDGVSAIAIHGNKSQAARTKALADFKRGRVSTLVATDIAARGLDIDRLPHVVNFDMPAVAEDYIHRIGRTGRAGEVGKAISLVSADERGLLTQVERLLKRRVDVEQISGFSQESPEEIAKNRAEQGKSAHGGRPGNTQGRRDRPGAFTRRPSRKGRGGSEASKSSGRRGGGGRRS